MQRCVTPAAAPPACLWTRSDDLMRRSRIRSTQRHHRIPGRKGRLRRAHQKRIVGDRNGTKESLRVKNAPVVSGAEGTHEIAATQGGRLPTPPLPHPVPAVTTLLISSDGCDDGAEARKKGRLRPVVKIHCLPSPPHRHARRHASFTTRTRARVVGLLTVAWSTYVRTAAHARRASDSGGTPCVMRVTAGCLPACQDEINKLPPIIVTEEFLSVPTGILKWA